MIVFYYVLLRQSRCFSVVWWARNVDWQAILYLLQGFLVPELELLNVAWARSTRLPVSNPLGSAGAKA